MAEKAKSPKAKAKKVNSRVVALEEETPKPEKARLFLSKKATDDFFLAQISGTPRVKVLPAADQSGAKVEVSVKVAAKVPSTASGAMAGIPSEYHGLFGNKLFKFMIENPRVRMVVPNSSAQPLEFIVEFDLPGAKVPS